VYDDHWQQSCQRRIHLALCPIKKPATQTAHLVFANTQAKAKKPKELFSANHRHRIN